MTSTQTATRGVSRGWWIFLVTGGLWLIVSMVVLRFNETSRSTVGVIIGIVFVLGMLSEFVMAAVEPGGWKWFHAILGVVFGLAALWCFIQPSDAFWALASVLGFLFLIYGTFEIIVAVATKDVNPLWWLGLIVGLLLLALAFWSSQQLVTVKANLLLFYVGLMALFRGISQIVFAFALRHADE